MWKKRSGSVILAAMAALAAASLPVIHGCARSGSAGQTRARLRGSGGGEVHGFAAAKLGQRESDPNSQLRVPDINIVLVNADDGTVSDATTSDTHGYFITPRVPPGRYRICLDGNGFLPTCDP